MAIELNHDAPFIRNPSSWPHEQIDNVNRKDAGVPYEFAYSFWQDAAHLAVLNDIGRPLKGDFVTGYAATLLHGDLFRLK